MFVKKLFSSKLHNLLYPKSSITFHSESGFRHQNWITMPNRSHAHSRKLPVLTVSVDGNISSGKSTLVSSLKELFPKSFDFQVELIPEPLEKWTDLQGHNLLEMFYDDPEKNNFMFQHYVQLTRLMEILKNPPEIQQDFDRKGVVKIMERSLQSNRYCFTELARREGRLKQAEVAVLSEWHDLLEKKFNLQLDLIIYLRSSPDTVYERMQKRARKEESSVPFEYLQSLHETYEDWLIRGKVGPMPNYVNGNGGDLTNQESNATGGSSQKIIVIDANKGKKDVAEECASLLRAFMKENGYEDDMESK